jgi:hypothetical protein
MKRRAQWPALFILEQVNRSTNYSPERGGNGAPAWNSPVGLSKSFLSSKGRWMTIFLARSSSRSYSACLFPAAIHSIPPVSNFPGEGKVGDLPLLTEPPLGADFAWSSPRSWLMGLPTANFGQDRRCYDRLRILIWASERPDSVARIRPLYDKVVGLAVLHEMKRFILIMKLCNHTQRI